MNPDPLSDVTIDLLNLEFESGGRARVDFEASGGCLSDVTVIPQRVTQDQVDQDNSNFPSTREGRATRIVRIARQSLAQSLRHVSHQVNFEGQRPLDQLSNERLIDDGTGGRGRARTPIDAEIRVKSICWSVGRVEFSLRIGSERSVQLGASIDTTRGDADAVLHRARRSLSATLLRLSMTLEEH